MTPVDYARRLVAMSAGERQPDDLATAVAIITRGLTDDDPDTLRAGWPLDADTVASAATFLSLEPTPQLVARALELAPTISDAMLNKGVGITTALTEERGTCRQPIRYGSDALCDRPRGHDQQHAVHPSRVTASGPGHVTGIDR